MMRTRDFDNLAFAIHHELGSHPTKDVFEYTTRLVEVICEVFGRYKGFNEARFREEVGLGKCYYPLANQPAKKQAAV